MCVWSFVSFVEWVGSGMRGILWCAFSIPLFSMTAFVLESFSWYSLKLQSLWIPFTVIRIYDNLWWCWKCQERIESLFIFTQSIVAHNHSLRMQYIVTHSCYAAIVRMQHFFFFALEFMPSTWKMYAKRRINKTPHNHCACRTYLIVCLHFMFGCLVGCYRCDSPFNWAPQLNRGAMHNIFGRFNYSARIYGQHA